MPFPFASQSFVMKPFDQPQPSRARKPDNILPLLVPFEYFIRESSKPSGKPSVLINIPHHIYILYYIWYVKVWTARSLALPFIFVIPHPGQQQEQEDEGDDYRQRDEDRQE